jgi:hypothetical protein
MASAGPQPESFNIQLLVDSIPALIHTAMPDGYPENGKQDHWGHRFQSLAVDD